MHLEWPFPLNMERFFLSRRYRSYSSPQNIGNLELELKKATSEITAAAATGTSIPLLPGQSATSELSAVFDSHYERKQVFGVEESGQLNDALQAFFRSKESVSDFKATGSGNTPAGVFAIKDALYLKNHVSREEAAFEARIAYYLLNTEFFSRHAHRVISFPTTFTENIHWVSLQERVPGVHVVNAPETDYRKYMELALQTPLLITEEDLRYSLVDSFSESSRSREFFKKISENVFWFHEKYDLSMKSRWGMWKAISWFYDHATVPMWDFWPFNARVIPGEPAKRYDYTKLYATKEAPGFELSQLLGARLCESKAELTSRSDLGERFNNLLEHGKQIYGRAEESPFLIDLLDNFDLYLEMSLLFFCQRRIAYLFYQQEELETELSIVKTNLGDKVTENSISNKLSTVRQFQRNYERLLLTVGPDHFRCQDSTRFLLDFEKAVKARGSSTYDI